MTNFPSRRLVLSQGTALVGAVSTGLLSSAVYANPKKIRIGFILPYTGNYAPSP